MHNVEGLGILYLVFMVSSWQRETHFWIYRVLLDDLLAPFSIFLKISISQPWLNQVNFAPYPQWLKRCIQDPPSSNSCWGSVSGFTCFAVHTQTHCVHSRVEIHQSAVDLSSSLIRAAFVWFLPHKSWVLVLTEILGVLCRALEGG